MKKFVLISCVSSKSDKRSIAKDLYISPLFRYNLKYANSLKPDNIFILSAKYGLIELDEEIDPYDLTLNKMKDSDVREWADEVLVKLGKKADFVNDSFLFLAGEKYRKYIVPHLKNYQIPMKGLGIGRQLKFLKEKTQ